MQNFPEVEFAITAPEDLGPNVAFTTRARTTLGAITTVVATSFRRLVLSAPFIQPNEVLNAEPLSSAISAALERGVQVEIASTLQGLHSIQLAHFGLEYEQQLKLYVSQSSLNSPRQLGSHAKFCVNDQLLAYLGSANLTGPGLSGHLEMGVLVKGYVAKQTMQFWDFLLERQFFIEFQD